ncbi:MAG: hypothetical protein C0623_11210 [Desulfuromonas sp.]|nr:MAG: hypothetical protein C0623_11210 [Desulfuromonas sp.]
MIMEDETTPRAADHQAAKDNCVKVDTGFNFEKTCLTVEAPGHVDNDVIDNFFNSVQLRGGLYAGESLRLVTPGLSIDYGIYNLRNNGTVEGGYTVGLLLTCDSELTCFDKEIVVGDVVFLPPSAETNVIVGGQASWSTLTFSREDFEDYFSSQTDARINPRSLNRVAIIGKNRVTINLLRFVRGVLLSNRKPVSVPDYHQLKQSLTHHLLELCFAAVFAEKPVPVDRKTTNNIGIVESAEAYLNRLEMEAISVLDLAKELGVSIRKLQYAFRDILGITPKRYLQIRRLNLVRKQLILKPDKTITEHASKAGFWHMAQFTKDYKAMFGESPRETLDKHKRLKST